jgi:trehalose 6-phosphate synthase/phosphatase
MGISMERSKSQQTLIVSNRLPVSLGYEGESISVKASSGGLVSGLAKVHESSESIWIGHPGLFPGDRGYEEIDGILQERDLAAVKIPKKDYKYYYNGFSNGAIWPLFHYFPAFMRYREKEFEAYQRVNQLFADAILALARPGDKIWVHDYQLMLLPKMLREQGAQLHIAYFHHIPFPTSEIFRTIPHRTEILEGLLGSDYIGFHTVDYVRHFLSAVARTTPYDIHVDEVLCGLHRSKVGAHPLGIAYDKIASQAESAKVKETKGTTFLGIDRLDYTKGIVERLSAFRELLKSNPGMVGKTRFIQLCVPSRVEIASYGSLKAAVERIVSQINGEFGEPGYTPVEYIYRSFAFAEVVELYKIADVAVITPLRDGLNLVCKEYVASRTEEDGVLILSEFAGAAAEMGEALMVNPYDVKKMAQTMETAIHMPEDEKKRRMRLLRKRCQDSNNIVWADNFINHWEKTLAKTSIPIDLKNEEMNELWQKVKKAKRCFLFLDNDGTLTEINDRPELAIPQQRALDILAKLTETEKFITTIVTGRDRDYCDRYFSESPLWIVAEHSAFLKSPQTNEWVKQFTFDEFETLRPDILELLNMYVGFVPGSEVEEKEAALVWHYRRADSKIAHDQARGLGNSLQQLLGQTSISVFPGKKSLEVRHVYSSKGFAVKALLKTLDFSNEDLFLTIGDDTTDEDMYRIFPNENQSIHVGESNAYAKYTLPNVDSVLTFLEGLTD